MIDQKPTQLIFLVSAPSGAGKTTLCERLMQEFGRLIYSVSCTTRAPRDGEEDGQHYRFLSQEAFADRIEAGCFLEWADVHGERYGTLQQDVLDALHEGLDVLMDLDVQGARQIRSFMQEGAGASWNCAYVDVFITPPSLESLRQRLQARGKDSGEIIQRRIAAAEAECAHWQQYQYLVVNDELGVSYDALRAIYVSEHHRIRREPRPYA